MFRLLWLRYKLYRMYKKHASLSKNSRVISDIKYKDIIKKMKRDIHVEELEYFYGQKLFLFCPTCGDELLSQHTDFKREESYTEGTVDTFKCSRCERESKWVSGVMPIPVLIDELSDKK